MKILNQSRALIVGLLAAGVVLAAGPAVAHDQDGPASSKSGRVPLPVHSITQGDKCVEPTDVMRRNHMQFILHQRDMTMHQGVRTTQHSLKNCVNCHADPKTGSVLGKEGFCESCHRYAAVSIDCFSCHSSEREASATAASPARSLNTDASQNKTDESAKGTKP